MIPKVIIPGGMKCGSASLYTYICNHPKFEKGDVREPCYFTRLYNWGISEYRRYYSGDKRHVDASVEYMCWPDCIERIKNTIPDVKLIFILRNPVDRAWSHYCHNLRHNNDYGSPKRETLKFYEALKVEEIRVNSFRTYRYYSYKERGLYAKYLDMWKKHFKDILVLKSEDLWENPKDNMELVWKHIGVEPFYQNKYGNHSDGINDKEMPENCREYLEEFYIKPNKELEKYGISFNKGGRHAEDSDDKNTGDIDN